MLDQPNCLGKCLYYNMYSLGKIEKGIVEITEIRTITADITKKGNNF